MAGARVVEEVTPPPGLGRVKVDFFIGRNGGSTSGES